MSLQIELLEQSFNYIKPYGNLFVSSFYETLLKTNSEIKSLFIGIDLEISKNQAWDSLHRGNVAKPEYSVKGPCNRDFDEQPGRDGGIAG